MRIYFFRLLYIHIFGFTVSTLLTLVLYVVFKAEQPSRAFRYQVFSWYSQINGNMTVRKNRASNGQKLHSL